MNKGYKRVKVDVTDLVAARADALHFYVDMKVLVECDENGNSEVSLYGPKQNVVRLMTYWGHEVEEGL